MTAFLDEDKLISLNNVVYKVVADTTEIIELGQEPDPLLMETVSTLDMRLKSGVEGYEVEAYVKTENESYCPECWDVELGKRISSVCSTCDGSGMLGSFQGPITTYVSKIQEIKRNIPFGLSEKKTEEMSVWTTNTPIFTKGSRLTFKDGKVFVVDDVPQQRRLQSTVNGESYVVKQLLKLIKRQGS